MKINNFLILFLMLINIFIIGCQQQVQDVSEQETIEIVDETPIDNEIEEEFDDGLDAALQELEEIENI